MFTQINKFHELSLCKTHLLEIKSRGIETFFVQTLLAFTKYEDRSLLLPIRAIELRWPPPCYMPPLIFEKIWRQGGHLSLMTLIPSYYPSFSFSGFAVSTISQQMKIWTIKKTCRNMIISYQK